MRGFNIIVVLCLIFCLVVELQAKKKNNEENKITEIKKGLYYTPKYTDQICGIIKIENGYILYISGRDFDDHLFIPDSTFSNDKLFLEWINGKFKYERPLPPDKN